MQRDDTTSAAETASERMRDYSFRPLSPDGLQGQTALWRCRSHRSSSLNFDICVTPMGAAIFGGIDVKLPRPKRGRINR